MATYASNDTDLVIDINGYFAAPAVGRAVVLRADAMPRHRHAHSRQRTALQWRADGRCADQPLRSAGHVAGIRVQRDRRAQRILGYLTLWPDGETKPVVSTLNALDGAITSNMAIVPNIDGKTDAFAGTTQLILDISGYFAP